MPRWPKAELAQRWRARAPLLTLLVGFVLSRLIVTRRGMAFDTFPLGRFWQYVHPTYLQERLWESLLYLHAQPPLFNLFLGAVLHIWNEPATLAFAACYFAVGLGLTLTMYALMVRLGSAAWLSALLTLLFILSPPALYFERYLFSEYPILLLLCSAALALQRFTAAGRWLDGAVAFVLMAVAIGARSHFQWPWLLAVLAVVAALTPAPRRRLWSAALPGVGMTLLLCVKNLVLFGTLTSSSWFGMNLMSMATFALPPGAAGQLEAQGVVTPLFARRPFGSLQGYSDLVSLPAPTGIPILDDEQTPSGEQNFNHAAYIEISRRFGRDAMQAIGRYPGAYLHAVAAAASLFFRPANDYEYFTGHRHCVPWWDALYSHVLYGQVVPVGRRSREEILDFSLANSVPHIGWFILLGMPLLWIFGLRRLLRARAAGDVATATTLAFILVTIAYGTVVGTAFNLGENQRYRFVLEPLVYVLAGALLARSPAPDALKAQATAAGCTAVAPGLVSGRI